MMISDRIKLGAKAMGIDLPDDAAGKMQRYWELVLETNRTLNLTRIVQEEKACNLHFLDSLAPLQFGYDIIPLGASVLDVGTGAGFPGVPIAMARPDVRMTLIDARRKRIDFILQAASGIAPGIEALHMRAEECVQSFDAVLARAVAAGPALMKILLPLVKTGGLAILWKGPGVLSEMCEIDKESSRFGGCLLEPIFYELPEENAKHCLVLIEKAR